MQQYGTAIISIFSFTRQNNGVLDFRFAVHSGNAYFIANRVYRLAVLLSEDGGPYRFVKYVKSVSVNKTRVLRLARNDKWFDDKQQYLKKKSHFCLRTTARNRLLKRQECSSRFYDNKTLIIRAVM